MKKLARQDRNGTRTTEDLRRRYNLNEIEMTKEELEYLKTLIVVDSFLSTTSTNAVQNKVITEVLNNKVNKETGKVLSSNDFTNEEKDKLANIDEELDKKVDKVEGKGLSTNDFTNTLLNKLNQIEANANVNIIESISVNGEDQPVTNKKVDLQINTSPYPIGTIYTNVNQVNPASLFGGIWEAVETETTYYMWKRTE